jgi:hypothetical protein
MNALVFIYEGTYDSTPNSTIIAMSNDTNKLIEKMRECINEDTEINEDDEYDDSCNFHITSDYTDIITLKHNNMDLYVSYRIQYDIEILD